MTSPLKMHSPPETVASQADVTLCRCGCRELLNPVFVRSLALRQQGHNPKPIALHLGFDHGYVKGILSHPPQFRLGHQSRNREELRARSCVACGGPVGHFGDSPYCWKQSCPGAEDRLVWKREWWREHDEAIAQRRFERSEMAESRRLARLADAQERRFERERDNQQIEYLRGLVGLGWQRDSRSMLLGPRVSSLQGMEERYGSYDWVPIKTDYSVEEYLQRRAARMILDLRDVLVDPALVGKALSQPDDLTDDERQILRAVYQDAEALALQGGSRG